MEFTKVLIILAATLLMAAPFLMEYQTFKHDKKKKISYKRFRIVVYTIIYAIAVTILLAVLTDIYAWFRNLSWVTWLADRLAISNKWIYFTNILVAVVINFLIGFAYVILSKFVRIGLKRMNLVKPKKKKTGEFTRRQKFQRKVIKFFHKETWYFVGNIVKALSIILSAAYAVIYIFYMIPAIFQADWIPYSFLWTLFHAGYTYPTITLLVLWEVYFFLEGIRRLEEECPELLSDKAEVTEEPVDLVVIDEEVKKQFHDYYAGELSMSDYVGEEISSTNHTEVTEYISQAVERDKRNPEKPKEIYLDCLDKLSESNSSVLINGTFFSEFSMYFLRYLSVTVARGDNIVFVCNSDSQIDTVYDYVKEGLSELSSLYCKGFSSGSVDFDDPIWRVVKISGEYDVIEEASIDDNSILITSLSYLCSAHFEREHSKFIHLLDTVVFVDSLKTVNTYNRQLAMLNTRLKHITKNSALLSKNGNVNEMFRVRYMSRQVRYICFDDTRTPGLDKVLKNLLAVDFESVDAMNFNPGTMVRLYKYEGQPDENGRRVCPQFLDSDEEVGALMNMAVLCLAKGAGSVTVFAGDSVPYENIAETIAANMGRVSIKADGSNIRLNSPYYNPDSYSVIIAMDSGDNLPAALRRYCSMTSDKPALVIVFSRPYMMRDYYLGNIGSVWGSSQLERIPVEEGSKKDVAQRILVRANAGGISEDEILNLASGVAQFDPLVKKRDINGILRAVLEIYGLSQEERMDLFKYFEYVSSQDFDENGVYTSGDKVLLRRQGALFDMINGRDMVIMVVGEKEIVLPVPRSRLTQNFIMGQNIIHEGNIYYIQKVDAAKGRVYARLAVGGKNDEAYQYIQARDYHVEMNEDDVELVFPTKHVILKRKESDVSVNEVYMSVFRAPMEVLTKGYFEIDPHTLAANADHNEYHSISDKGNDSAAKQTYRKYGNISNPFYPAESIIRTAHLNSSEKGALMMSLRICGQFGGNVDRTMTLAAVMLNEILRSMFPSVADSIAVYPVLHGEMPEEYQTIYEKQPHIKVDGESELISRTDFDLVIIEDCATDLGVVSVLLSAGDDVLNTLFKPIFDYLNWYLNSEEKSDYLYYGLDCEPGCFDFDSLYKLSKLLGDDKHDLKFVDLDTVVEYSVCDFCGKRYQKGGDVIELEDGRVMCRSCAGNLVGNNKKALKAHLESAKIFLESTYGVKLDDDYEFCFESTVKIANTLKQHRELKKRGADIPLKSYVDDKKKIHVEYSVPSVNLSELLVRELTHAWQLKHLPELNEELAEGQLALVAIQYLKFLNQQSLVTVRTNYYESTGNPSGLGYRRLAKELLENPQYNNNPFRYLLEISGIHSDDDFVPQDPVIIGEDDYGKPYESDETGRDPDGIVSYLYYESLTATHQGAYEILLDAIQNHDETVVVSGCTFDDISKVSDAISYDHPELFWYRTFSMRGEEVMPVYGASAEESELIQKKIDEAVPKFLDGIDETTSAYDATVRIYAKLISSVDYDTIALNKQKQEGGPEKDKIDYLRTIPGVFLNGKAVCEGYARALQYLLQKCGIECAEVAGHIRKESGQDEEAHAWNIAKIDGEYYYLDVTWDDGSDTIQSVKQNYVGFDYFCITTEELLRTRNIDLSPATMPACTSVEANYFYHNDMVLDSYDLSKLKAIAQAAAGSGKSSFTFKCKTKSVYDTAIEKLCASGQDCYEVLKSLTKLNKQILTNSYSYTYNKNIYTVTIRFKFK
ncbi:MAG: hypothetical protein LUH18_01950 [Oscillospiraceae bacterium]|nr:hypothetical protein [Oscillospiraceae bacterium]